MRQLQLVQLECSAEKAIAADPDYQQAVAEENWGRLAHAVLRIVGRTITAAPAGLDQHHWGSYLAVDAESREIVGSCLFKTPPTAERSVEIAYHTYPEFEGRGYATEMARNLVELARGSTAVHRVIAHTLPETNASTRVLEKAGMDFVGEVIDPDDGRVWRWQLQVNHLLPDNYPQ